MSQNFIEKLVGNALAVKIHLISKRAYTYKACNKMYTVYRQIIVFSFVEVRPYRYIMHRPSMPTKNIADPFLLMEILSTSKFSCTSACNTYKEKKIK